MSELDHYDYELPPELIAQEPLPGRADSRLLVVDRPTKHILHHHVRDLPELLRPGDSLVVNESRVVPARLVGHRTLTGGRWAGLFLSVDDDGLWRLLGKTRGKLSAGETITLHDGTGRPDLQLTLRAKQPGGVWTARPSEAVDVWSTLERIGRIPLPHYIRGGTMHEADRERYQTVYAQTPGSAAAPTAGLHLSQSLLDRLVNAGIQLHRVTLHVGLDTFRPINVDALADHTMHSEWCELRAETAAALNACREQGGRLVAIGTTSVRVLESAADETGRLGAFSGHTNLFIRPPYAFRAVDALLTNFHLPRSTLLVLVRTFGGDELMQRAYRAAIDERYRFYSYGDAMLVL